MKIPITIVVLFTIFILQTESSVAMDPMCPVHYTVTGFGNNTNVSNSSTDARLEAIQKMNAVLNANAPYMYAYVENVTYTRTGDTWSSIGISCKIHFVIVKTCPNPWGTFDEISDDYGDAFMN